MAQWQEPGSSPSPAFGRLLLPAVSADSNKPDDKRSSIQIEIPRARGQVVVEWPTYHAKHCLALLRELLQQIRIDEIWLATETLDMRAGPDNAVARVVQGFGSARTQRAYLFANKWCWSMMAAVSGCAPAGLTGESSTGANPGAGSALI